MMQNQLLENLFVYKKTVALLAAFKLGLFQKIKKYGFLNKETFNRLGWNERYTELLCIYLKSEGYLIVVDDGWKICEDFEKQLDAFEKICEHENALYHKWLVPELIVSSVQSYTDDRMFDREGFITEEQRAYDNVMYGNNVNLIAFHILRKLKSERIYSARCLEYGRSTGQIGQALKKHITEISIDVVSLDQDFDHQASYNLILIYNTIHYKTPEEWKTIFTHMKKVLDEDGFICIVDVFFKEDNIFRNTVLLDWITHGGVYNIYDRKVAEQLQSTGFTKIEQQTINSISTDMLFAYK